MTTIEFAIDETGNRLLQDAVFEGEEFDDLTIRGISDSTMLKNVRFLNCTTRGAAKIRKGVFLQDVTFQNLDCGDSLFISSESIVSGVKIFGIQPGALLIEPQEPDTYRMDESEEGEVLVDVADYEGHVVIIGFPGRNIRKNENRHVTIKSSWKDAVNWKELGLGPVSFWRINLKKLSLCNAEQGVFGLPNPKDVERYDKVLRERESLESAGVVFD